MSSQLCLLCILAEQFILIFAIHPFSSILILFTSFLFFFFIPYLALLKALGAANPSFESAFRVGGCRSKTPVDPLLGRPPSHPRLGSVNLPTLAHRHAVPVLDPVV